MDFRTLLVALAALVFSTSGCARLASTRAATLMIRAPNKVDPGAMWTNLRPLSPPADPGDQRFWVEVGPPRASLLVSTIEPKRADGSRPVGTILLLHGAYGRSEDMLNTANTFRASGYRAVLVDMRGHGRSTGERITYGVQESKDLSQVIDLLERRHLVEGKVGVYGFSFGGATAIDLAALDPRVGAVVAIAPFSSLRDAAGHIIRTKIPGAELFVTEHWIDRTIQEASRQGEFDWQAADTVAAIQRTEARVLLVHGDADRFVEPYHSVRLNQAAGARSRIVLVPGAGHDDLATDDQGAVARLALSWFNRWIATEPDA